MMTNTLGDIRDTREIIVEIVDCIAPNDRVPGLVVKTMANMAVSLLVNLAL